MFDASPFVPSPFVTMAVSFVVGTDVAGVLGAVDRGPVAMKPSANDALCTAAHA